MEVTKKKHSHYLKKSRRNIIQITSDGWALCDDHTLWRLGAKLNGTYEWIQIPNVPQPTEEKD